MLEARRSLAVALRTIQASVSFGSVKPSLEGENPEVSQKGPTSLLLTLTSREDFEPRQLFRVPPCRKGPIYSGALMLSLGFEPRPYGTTVIVTIHYTGWAYVFKFSCTLNNLKQGKMV
ncbi:hypothetical protein TNCV_1546031 [Trichonephila clavipes]|nr:hypothetical protein TNCV_1546031 [Trichonephila clavipes]